MLNHLFSPNRKYFIGCYLWLHLLSALTYPVLCPQNAPASSFSHFLSEMMARKAEYPNWALQLVGLS